MKPTSWSACLTLALTVVAIAPLPCAANPPASSPVNWTEAERAANPLAFVDATIAEVKQELAAKRTAEQNLSGELARLGAECSRVNDRIASACEDAEKFRVYYHLGVFPVSIDGNSYGDRQTVWEQVSKVLAEKDGLEKTLERLEETRRATRIDFERILRRVNDLESSLAELHAWRERVITDRLPDHAADLIPRVQGLLSETPPAPTPHEQCVEAFLKRGQGCPTQSKAKPAFGQY